MCEQEDRRVATEPLRRDERCGGEPCATEDRRKKFRLASSWNMVTSLCLKRADCIGIDLVIGLPRC